MKRQIRNHSKYTITPDGGVEHIRSKKQSNIYIDSNGIVKVSCVNDNGKKVKLNLDVALMTTFKYIKGCETMPIRHIDGDRLNNNLDNLEWIISNEKTIRGFSGYTISEGGVVFNKKTGNTISVRINKGGYKKLSLKNDDGIIKTTTLHRLLMLTYKYIKGCELLDVDHIDCNKLNNDLDNLQWVSKKENTHRAIINNLYSDNRSIISDDVVIKIRKEYIPGFNGNKMELMKKYNIKKSMFYYIVNDEYRTDLPLTNDINPYINGEKNTYVKGASYGDKEIKKISEYFSLPKKERDNVDVFAKKLKISTSTLYNIKKTLK